MVSLVQAISALPSAASQQALTDGWLDLWTNERCELTITMPCLLKCLGAFACGSVVVKQMMKQLLQAGQESSAPDYLPRLLDMLILSDLPHGAKMLNVLLDQLSDPWIEPVVTHILDIVLVCIEELRLQTMEHRPHLGAMDTSDVTDSTKHDWSELDECLAAEGTKVVAIDARNINVLAYRVLRFLDLIVLDNVATQSPRRQQLRSSLLQQPMLYEPLAHFFSLDTTSPLAKATLARLLQSCLTLVKKENTPVIPIDPHFE
ncbi:hypothetical protein DM01DRAFT_1081754 [Hesseltinella vesiculosa]|uniref:Uncharacterized protein n=1 Tax=Hesseltinella vesiculosa TaxID=101127 RepID=A0A1X2GDZ7_9FUNG|nr:hypothetical protein DM01DRAFT_1081754 [Hesseltinella vesiculosa]